MPGFVQHISNTGYGYMDPWVDGLRHNVPYFDSSMQRIAPYVPPVQPVIDATDRCIDTVRETAGKRVVALRETQSAVQGKTMVIGAAASSRVRKIFHENVILCRIHAASLTLVDSTDGIIDRLLPPTNDEMSLVEHGKRADVTVVSRVVNIPIQISLRISRLVVVTVRDLEGKASHRCHVFMELSLAKKDELVRVTAAGTRQLKDKCSGAAESSALALQRRREAAKERAQAVVVWAGDGMCVLASRAHLPQAQQWTAEKAASVKLTASLVANEAALRAFNATSRVAGVDRTAQVFEKVGQYIPSAQKAVTKTKQM